MSSETTTSNLSRFPSVLVSRQNDTVVAVRGSDTNPAEPSVAMSWVGSVGATEAPPDYSAVPIPPEPMTYTFLPPSGNNTRTTLSPPLDAEDQRPLFTISIHPDPFIPILANTILYRGPDPEGQESIVGSFELALPNDVLAGSVMLNTSFTAVSGLRKMMDSAFPSYRVPVTHEVRYLWQFDPVNSLRFIWISRGHSATCYAHPNSDTRNAFQVATGAPKLAELTGRRDVPYQRLTNLTLWPAAHALPLLEHIVLTALIVERRRLSKMVAAQMRAAMTRIVTY